ncbi:MAG: FKBP-type peptidyl-prolyl cis-trans isomerase [Bowdeniella nasicola]|nr:FKBP-type peptidyl-prolyl cis-trans isomerase [Bowdeniella nasicola]
MKRILALASAGLLALSLTACSNDNNTAGEEKSASSPGATSDIDATAPLFEVEGDRGQEPTLTFSGEAPATLQRYVMDANPDGKEVGATDAVYALYHGQVWDGDIFDSAYQRNAPIVFPLTGVIRGWQEGLTGTHVGERVQLSIPSELGYPEGTPDGSIKPGETIVFVVEIIDAAGLDTPGDPDAEAVADPADFGVKLTRDDEGRLQSGELLADGADMDPMEPTVLFQGSDDTKISATDQVALRIVRLQADAPQSDVSDELLTMGADQLPKADQLRVGSIVVAGEGKAGSMADSAIIFEVIKIFRE